MLRQELQSYFDRVYPDSKIDTEHSIGGQVHIRFELGEGKDNGTIKRVNQSTERAWEIVNTRFFTTDKNGNDVLEKDEVKIIIGKLPVKDINVENILNGLQIPKWGLTLA